MTTHVPSWIPSVEECWSAFVDGVRAGEGHQNYPAGVAAIRALVAERASKVTSDMSKWVPPWADPHTPITLDGVDINEWRELRSLIETHCGKDGTLSFRLRRMMATTLGTHPNLVTTAPERHEKAGEELRKDVEMLLDILQPDNLRRYAMTRGTDPGFWLTDGFVRFVLARRQEVHHALAVTEPNRAPAQPARSTREPLTTDGCPEPDDETLADLLEEIADEFPFDGKRRWIKLAEKRLRAPPPAREKDGEADEASVPYLDAELARRFFVEEIETYAKLYPNATTDEIQRAGMRAVFARLGRRAAPRSPSPLSADVNAKRLAQSMVAVLVHDLGYSMEFRPLYGHAPMRHEFAWAWAVNVLAGEFEDTVRVEVRERAAPAPSIAQQTAPSEAGGAPVSVDRVASAIAPAFCDDPFEDLRPEMQEDLRKAARLAIGCLASRGARGTEEADDNGHELRIGCLEIADAANRDQHGDMRDALRRLESRLNALESAPASVERDEALEEAAKRRLHLLLGHVYFALGLSAMNKPLTPISDELRKTADEVGEWLRALKSPPAPSSASVTPKNDGGAG